MCKNVHKIGKLIFIESSKVSTGAYKTFFKSKM